MMNMKGIYQPDHIIDDKTSGIAAAALYRSRTDNPRRALLVHALGFPSAQAVVPVHEKQPDILKACENHHVLFLGAPTLIEPAAIPYCVNQALHVLREMGEDTVALPMHGMAVSMAAIPWLRLLNHDGTIGVRHTIDERRYQHGMLRFDGLSFVSPAGYHGRIKDGDAKLLGIGFVQNYAFYLRQRAIALAQPYTLDSLGVARTPRTMVASMARILLEGQTPASDPNYTPDVQFYFDPADQLVMHRGHHPMTGLNLISMGGDPKHHYDAAVAAQIHQMRVDEIYEKNLGV